MAEPTAAERKAYAKAGYSMPDGSYYIRDGAEGVSDLENAIKAVGRTTNAAGEIAANAVRRHIMTRASALKRTDLIPDTWNSDGSLKHADAEEFVAHFGVKGMHWGVRKSQIRTSEDAHKDLAKIEKKRNSLSRKLLPAGNVIAGAGALAGTSKRVLKLQEVKDVSGSKRLIPGKNTPTLTPQNREHFEKKIDRETYAKYITAGALTTTALLATAYFGRTRIDDPEFAKLVTKGSLILAGAQTLHTSGIVAGIHRNIYDRELTAKKRALKSELKTFK